MGRFVPFLLPWDKQQLESSSTAQYLEQTIASDCINCSEIRLNEINGGMKALCLWASLQFGPSFHSCFINASNGLTVAQTI